LKGFVCFLGAHYIAFFRDLLNDEDNSNDLSYNNRSISFK